MLCLYLLEATCGLQARQLKLFECIADSCFEEQTDSFDLCSASPQVYLAQHQ